MGVGGGGSVPSVHPSPYSRASYQTILLIRCLAGVSSQCSHLARVIHLRRVHQEKKASLESDFFVSHQMLPLLWAYSATDMSVPDTHLRKCQLLE